MREEEKIKKGLLYWTADPELKEMKRKAHNLNVDYNQTHEDEVEKRKKILKDMVGKMGEDGFIQGPVFFHYGRHTKIGKRFFGNFNLTIQDDAEVTIGDDCNFGPNTTIVTPLHPMVASERTGIVSKDGEAKRMCWAKPVHIGDRCWFGASVTVCPGVTIGDNCVIGAGSVVTKDIPADCFAAGAPCKVIRRITEKESVAYKTEILTDDLILS